MHRTYMYLQMCVSGLTVGLRLLYFGGAGHAPSVKKERPAIAQPQQGLEHGASSQNSQTFTPVPIAKP